jgi:hypothetical protein
MKKKNKPKVIYVYRDELMTIPDDPARPHTVELLRTDKDAQNYERIRPDPKCWERYVLDPKQ